MKLILINGPSGIGKSTLAETLSKAIPLSFYLDIDAQRRYISHYRENMMDSWKLSINASKAITENHLKAGHDVIVDKMLREKGNAIDEFVALGKRCKADIYEFILWADKDTVVERAEKRGYKENSLFTREKCILFWEEINKLKDKRKDAIIVDAQNQSADEVLKEVKKQIGI